MVQEELMSNEKDPAEELWEHRNDPDEWSDEAEEIEARPSGSAMVSFRLPWEELEELDEAAAATGESLSEFIRTSLRIRLAGMSRATFVEMTYGGAKGFKWHGDIPARILGTEASSVPEQPSHHPLAGTTP
jgi:Ribbon-helix-helix protein, copG family